jgi:hypothetical protein
MRRRRKDLALPLIGLAYVVGQAEKRAFLVLDESGAVIDVVHNLMQPPQRRIIADQQDASVIFEQLI